MTEVTAIAEALLDPDDGAQGVGCGFEANAGEFFKGDISRTRSRRLNRCIHVNLEFAKIADVRDGKGRARSGLFPDDSVQGWSQQAMIRNLGLHGSGSDFGERSQPETPL